MGEGGSIPGIVAYVTLINCPFVVNAKSFLQLQFNGTSRKKSELVLPVLYPSINGARCRK